MSTVFADRLAEPRSSVIVSDARVGVVEAVVVLHEPELLARSGVSL